MKMSERRGISRRLAAAPRSGIPREDAVAGRVKPHTHIYTGVATKTINLTEGAYVRLHTLKREGESFSDVVDRLTGKFALLELVGVLDEKSALRIRRAKRDFGRRLRRSVNAPRRG